MRCITVCEPFASALIFGSKPVENRKTRLLIRGAVLIHAGLNLDWFDAATWVHERWPECPSSFLEAYRMFKPRMGNVIGIGYFAEGFKFSEAAPTQLTTWHTGPICFPLLDRVAVDPFPLRGNRGAFIVPASEIPKAVLEAAEQLTERVERRASRRSA